MTEEFTDDSTAEEFKRLDACLLDWPAIAKDGIPPIPFLREPYLVRGFRVLAFGPKESAKSMWAAWNAAALTRAGERVVYVSQENPSLVNVGRLVRLGADPRFLDFYQDADLNLSRRIHREWLIAKSTGAALTVLDTLSATWSGEERDNTDFATFDRTFMMPLVAQTGACLLALDHSGHAGGAARGASAKGQKVDIELEFQPSAKDGTRFKIFHRKFRGGTKEPVTWFRVVDTEHNGLGIIEDGPEDDQAPDSTKTTDTDLELAILRIVEGRDDWPSTREVERALREADVKASTARIVAAVKNLRDGETS